MALTAVNLTRIVYMSSLSSYSTCNKIASIAVIKAWKVHMSSLSSSNFLLALIAVFLTRIVMGVLVHSHFIYLCDIKITFIQNDDIDYTSV